MLLTKSFKKIIINIKQNYFQFLITYKSKFIKSFKNINIYETKPFLENRKKNLLNLSKTHIYIKQIHFILLYNHCKYI